MEYRFPPFDLSRRAAAALAARVLQELEPHRRDLPELRQLDRRLRACATGAGWVIDWGQHVGGRLSQPSRDPAWRAAVEAMRAAWSLLAEHDSHGQWAAAVAERARAALAAAGRPTDRLEAVYYATGEALEQLYQPDGDEAVDWNRISVVVGNDPAGARAQPLPRRST